MHTYWKECDGWTVGTLPRHAIRAFKTEEAAACYASFLNGGESPWRDPLFAVKSFLAGES